MMLLGAHLAAASPDSYGFATGKYTVDMRVRFPAPYEGTRLAVANSSVCFDNFVGALAVVEFRVKPAAASMRELVTLVAQSPGLPDRPPYTMTIPLPNGIGTDIQAFGYDEGPAGAIDRAAEREAAKSTWRMYRQELYLDEDTQPFAVIEWHHTTTRIRILRVSSPAITGRLDHSERGGESRCCGSARAANGPAGSTVLPPREGCTWEPGARSWCRIVPYDSAPAHNSTVK
jgi:hypothetical protein